MSASNDASAIARTLSRFRGLRAWVVGDIMLDVWIRGETARVSPEAPVPVVRVRERAASPGGAANVARAVAALGATVSLAGVIGGDGEGDELLRLCASAGVETSAVLVARARRTTSKVRILAREQQIVRYDSEDARELDDDVVDALVATLGAAAPPDVIVVSDYGKGVAAPRFLEWLLAWSARRGVPSLLDPKGVDFRRYAGASVITPNLLELETAVGTSVDPDDDRALALASARLAADSGARAIVTTLGARGMAVWERDRPLAYVPATARRVADVTGAGDTVIAVLALGLAAGLPLVGAATLASLAGGLAVEVPGCAVIGVRDLARAVPAPPQVCGAIDRAELAERVALWRQRGDAIVFTNGCFDLLHTGHLALLEGARAEGDILVVGLNGDESVRALKGPTRPLNPVGDRARVLASLRCVDAVVVFDAPTPLELIEAVRPDVLVKGADYHLDDIVGRREVESWGGRVVLVPLVAARSTTRLVSLALERTDTGTSVEATPREKGGSLALRPRAPSDE